MQRAIYFLPNSTHSADGYVLDQTQLTVQRATFLPNSTHCAVGNIIFDQTRLTVEHMACAVRHNFDQTVVIENFTQFVGKLKNYRPILSEN